MGLHAQSKRKRDKRSVDMSTADPEPDVWQPPPEEECSEETYTMVPPGGAPGIDEVKVRMVHHDRSHELVEFAIVQQLRHKGAWRTVAAADSCHYTDVHLHRYGRRADARVGEPERLMDIAGPADMYDGYDLAYGRIVDGWADNKQRWGNG